MEEENKKELTPSQYFDYLKGSKNTITLEAIKDSFEVFIKLAEKYKKLGQIESLKKLCFLADSLKKEEKLIEIGITTFIYRDVIEDYIENVADNTVKIIELSRYMREIPDDLVDIVKASREIFDEIYVVFTDYTGKEERKVEKERRDKDPILFGVFKSNSGGFISDRFYFLGDWVDEYCDLTLDKMVAQYKKERNESPTTTISIPNTIEELLDLMKSYAEVIDSNKKQRHLLNIDGSEDEPLETPIYMHKPVEKKKSFFDKIRSVISIMKIRKSDDSKS